MQPNNKNIDYIEYNNKYVFDKAYKKEQLDYKKFEYNDTIILKGTAGTGKTTAISKHLEKYMKANPDIKFLSIVDRITLSDQHLKSFKDINIKSYKDKKANPLTLSSYIICINSLQRLAELTKEHKNKYVVFIDEITSFLSLTHNELLNKNIKYIYNLLTSIIKNAHKVIVADAIILDNTLDFLKSRINEDNKTLFIYNKYKKFTGVEAIHIKDENIFLNKLINQCKAGEPFLFGCDSSTIATKFYNKCKAEIDIVLAEAILTEEETEEEIKLINTNNKTKKEIKKALLRATETKKAVETLKKYKDSFILLTAEANIEITDAEKQFEGKFVFYSPKITYGVDFSIETAQNVYIYQEGKSIMPNGTFQQSSRCRNIKKLYYYADVKNNEDKYDTIEGVKKSLTKNIEYFKISNSSLYNVSTTYDDDEEIYKVNENSFFILYCYTEYINNIYKVNMTQHFKDILINNGFVLSEEGETIKISKELNLEIKELTKEIKEKLFNEFIEANDKTEEKFESFIRHIEFLKLPIYTNKENDETGEIDTVVNVELLEKFKNEIIDKHSLQDHLNIMRMLKDDAYIDEKIQAAINNSYDVKNISMSYNQIKSIRTLEAKYNISPLDVDFAYEGSIEMDDKYYINLKNIFRISKPKPKDYEELRKFYVSMIKNVTTNDLIKSFQSKKKETRDIRLYNINDEYIKDHLELNKFSNPNCKNFHEQFIEKFEIPIFENKYMFQNEEEEENIEYSCALLDVFY